MVLIRHLAVELGVHPLVDDTHRALAEHAREVVPPELFQLSRPPWVLTPDFWGVLPQLHIISAGPR